MATGLYSLVSFDYSWRHTGPDLLSTIAGSLVVPVLYGLAWFLSTRGDQEVAVRAFVASATWVGGAFLIVAAHFPPWTLGSSVHLRASIAEPIILGVPLLIATGVGVWQARAMTRRLAASSGRTIA